MEPILLRRSLCEQLADHYVEHYTELGPQSVKELATLAGVSEATVRSALRLADERLASVGKTLTVADGHSSWRVQPTSAQREFAVSLRGRLTSIHSELRRYKEKMHVLPEKDEATERMLDDVQAAVELAAEVLAEV